MSNDEWIGLIERDKSESSYWKNLVEKGKRYEGAEDDFKKLRCENTDYLMGLVEKYGWPSKDTLGKEINIAAFRTARNSIQSPDKMRYFLTKIEISVQKGESEKNIWAGLNDCIKCYEGKKQIYGFFLEWHESGDLYANVENVDKANKLRAEIGMESIELALIAHKKELEKSPGSKPKDIKKHNDMAKNWAQSVGW